MLRSNEDEVFTLYVLCKKVLPWDLHFWLRKMGNWLLIMESLGTQCNALEPVEERRSDESIYAEAIDVVRRSWIRLMYVETFENQKSKWKMLESWGLVSSGQWLVYGPTLGVTYTTIEWTVSVVRPYTGPQCLLVLLYSCSSLDRRICFLENCSTYLATHETL